MMKVFVATTVFLLITMTWIKLEAETLPGVKKILFLGDSITYSGQYVEFFEFILRAKLPSRQFEIINIGLPSETACGLSEPNHAGGAFPRPNVQDRLVRALELVKPDLVIACYGMNDGIYYPFGEERFTQFQAGMTLLKKRVEEAHAKLILLTPPPFDSSPIQKSCLLAGKPAYGSDRPFSGYDEVLGRYSNWLISERKQGWKVIDIHTAMRNYLDSQRKENTNFILASDGVHLNETGHWQITLELLKYLKLPVKEVPFAQAETESGVLKFSETLALIQKRQRILKDSWLTAIGHKRPGMNPGISTEEAKRQSLEIERQLQSLEERK